MKRLVTCAAWVVLAIWNSGLAQVTPEAQKLLDKAVQAQCHMRVVISLEFKLVQLSASAGTRAKLWE
jgi:hypothetical protein